MRTMKHSRRRILKAIGEGYDKARAKRQRDAIRNLFQSERQHLLTLKGVQIIPSEYLEDGKKQILQNFASALYNSSAVHWTITDDPDPFLCGRVRLEGTLRVAEPKEEA